MIYRLKISQVEQTCLFELSWEQGRQLTAQLPFPGRLTERYATWQHLYRCYYQFGLEDESGVESQSGLRGRTVRSGQVVTPPPDWQGQLVQAEAMLLADFQDWLRQGPLFEICRELSMTTRAVAMSDQGPRDLLISCTSMALERLPWETWEITQAEKKSRAGAVAVCPWRISRLPVTVPEGVARAKQIRGKASVLVVLGDATGLDFQSELKAIDTLKRLADVHLLGWTPGANPQRLKQTICDTLQASPGWDMLLFFGHSNEANTVGGKIAIAPNTTLSMRELTPYLQQAKERGLQFALFNSCQGLDIAQTLIGLGLSQVAIMREPIHNRVAQSFLIEFLRCLAQFEDVHTALQSASWHLQTNNALSFPSAYLVPSLFRHRAGVLFRLHPVGWRAGAKAGLKSCLPHGWPAPRLRTSLLCLLTLLSLVVPSDSAVARRMMARRLWSQAMYRQLTGNLASGKAATRPPVLLVQIDQDSIRKGIPSGRPNPMDRAYLASIVDRLSALEVRVIAIDYWLDRPQIENDVRFSQSLQQAADKGIWLIFGAVLESGSEVGIREDLASLDWVMQGYTNTPRWYLRALATRRTCYIHCPFTYLVALTQLTLQTPLATAITPTETRSTTLRTALLETIQIETIQTAPQSEALNTLYTRRLSPLASLSRWWHQRWLHPILDFSLPPVQVFDRLSADHLLSADLLQLKAQFDWSEQVVIVAAGDYGEAGTDFHKDYSALPPAIAYWHWQYANGSKVFTGGEASAYAVHHFVQDHWVVPLPTILMVVIGAISGRAIAYGLRRSPLSSRQQWLSISGLSAAYGLISLHLYITVPILLPWLVPTFTVWLYYIPPLPSRLARFG